MGLRLSEWSVPRALRLEDLHLLATIPIEHSTDEVVAAQREEATKRTGIPRQIVSDHDSDVKQGSELFATQHPQTVVTYDAAHHGAIVLKKRLEAHPRWAALITRLGQWTSSRVQAALEATPVKARHSWCAASIPPSVQSQRRLAPVNTSRPTTNQRQAEVCIGSGANLMPRGAPEPVKMSELCINDRRSPPPG